MPNNPPLDARLDDPQGFAHHFAQTNGIDLHYVEEGQGPLVILLHGFPYLWYMWRRQIRALAAAGYRVVAPDIRGFGQSECPATAEACNMLNCVGDLVGLMQQLGETSAVIIGHDLGAWVAYAAAQLRPDLFRAVGLLNTPVTPREAQRPSAQWQMLQDKTGKRFYQAHFASGAATAEMDADIRKTLRSTYYSISGDAVGAERWRLFIGTDEQFMDTVCDPAQFPAWLSDTAIDYYVGEYARKGFAAPLSHYAARDRNWALSAFADGLKVQQPSLFIGGAADPAAELFMANFGKLESHMPGLRQKVLLDGVGHSAAEERPERVNQLLLEFLAGL
ncbi:alpha/beta fold hydrolase [Pseudomonas sp. N040]|uniref:alpha/beta fold hydrolase n=1 Tax=Pseudomonas sp. N040 TaxID=2785325 RepID=UPI0018A2BC00|nr:alpha/beta hydrolase [Pseudomonas sp. N040]MBF7731558.1 alpha/beta hydrolase [Pseudomonas sp. N040]MBW7015202.1 alpha/beta hydrolase [Pseudomonas sp. N040]